MPKPYVARINPRIDDDDLVALIGAPLAFHLSAQPDTLRAGKPFEAFTHSEDRPAGVFVDMSGNEVRIAREDLEPIVANTRALLAQSSAGLPIDGDQDHDKGRAYGWIKGVELSGDVVTLTPEWTDLGVEAIGKKIKQFFSVTLDLVKKCITGGSLTNWPAITGLKPIELSSSTEVNMDEETINMIVERVLAALDARAEEMAKKKEADNTPAPVAMSAAPQMTEAQFAQRVQAETARGIAEYERRRGLADFAATIASRSALDGGTLAQALIALPPEQAETWRAILDTTASVDFSRIGHNKRAQAQKRALPDYVLADLRAGKIALTDLASPTMRGVLEAPLEEYDTAEFSAANGGK